MHSAAWFFTFHYLAPLCTSLLCSVRLQELHNKQMAKMRQCVEWGFGKLVAQYAFLDFKKNLKIYMQPVGKIMVVGVLLCNCHTCLHSSQTSDYFRLDPPTLEKYLDA